MESFLIQSARDFSELASRWMQQIIETVPEFTANRWFEKFSNETILLSLLSLTSAGVIILLAYGIYRWRLKAGKTTWFQKFFVAVMRPIFFLAWILGLYYALAPLLLNLETQNIQLLPLTAWLIKVASLLLLYWLITRLVKTGLLFLKERTAQTHNQMDDLIVTLLIKVKQMILGVVGFALALQYFHFPSRFEFVFQKTLAIALILTLAWVLNQTVSVFKTYFLQRYRLDEADNFNARKIHTQFQVLEKVAFVAIAIFAVASIFMLFESLRHLGSSILASAGIVGIIVGFAAQRTLADLFAGFKIALTQPIRLDDAVILEGKFGRIEEITLTYVVVKIWDQRRLIVPLSYFNEKVFQNWTRKSTDLIGAVMLYLDYGVPITALREQAKKIVEKSQWWNRAVFGLQVTDLRENTMEVRVIASANDASAAFNLRCQIREEMIDFITQDYPECLPKTRWEGALQKNSESNQLQPIN